jgi:hypothetical protein
VFDYVQVTQNGNPIANSYNGYSTNVTQLTPAGSGNVVVNSFSYQTSTLGRYYQPTSSPLINAGSRTADQSGLYHYTVTTNQSKETNSVIDIGFHYIALSAGLPWDTDGDGLPDYLEDRNGNGTFDSGETDWQTSNSGLSGPAALQVFTPLK